MVMPGVTTRKPRLNRLLPGVRTALIVCQAISIAITVVLPLPVAIFRAMRNSSGLDCSLAPFRCWRNLSCRRSLRATSVNQMAVSTASTWQKNGRTLWNWWWRQWVSRRWVAGVTPQSDGFGIARHRAT